MKLEYVVSVLKVIDAATLFGLKEILLLSPVSIVTQIYTAVSFLTPYLLQI